MRMAQAQAANAPDTSQLLEEVKGLLSSQVSLAGDVEQQVVRLQEKLPKAGMAAAADWFTAVAVAAEVDRVVGAIGEVRNLGVSGPSADDLFDSRRALMAANRELRRVIAVGRVRCDPVPTPPYEAKDLGPLTQFATKVAEIATSMSSLATSVTTDQIFQISRQEVRQELVKLAVITGETANQLSARADVLLRQVQEKYRAQTTGKEGSTNANRKMSTGDHLRDASATEFLSLIDWLDAAKENGTDEKNSHLDLNGIHRANIARQLFSDQYWTKINEVHASGQGDVRMALIKDDIGNWNLKSFDSDPTKLLDAYRKVGLAALNTLAKVAAGGNAQVNLQRIQDLATDHLSTAEAKANASADLKRERDTTVASIQKLLDRANAVSSENETRYTDALNTQKSKRLSLSTAEADVRVKQDLLNKKNEAYVASLKAQAPIEVRTEAESQRDTAEDDYNASVRELASAHASLTSATQEVDAILKPYQLEMRALVEKAAIEIETLGRIGGALQKSSAAPAGGLPANPLGGPKP